MLFIPRENIITLSKKVFSCIDYHQSGRLFSCDSSLRCTQNTHIWEILNNFYFLSEVVNIHIADPVRCYVKSVWEWVSSCTDFRLVLPCGFISPLMYSFLHSLIYLTNIDWKPSHLWLLLLQHSKREFIWEKKFLLEIWRGQPFQGSCVHPHFLDSTYFFKKQNGLILEPMSEKWQVFVIWGN